jgi:hypothetical protein
MGKKNDMPEIEKGEQFAMRTQNPEEKKRWEEDEIPEYRIELDLSEDQEKELVKQVKEEFEALKDERKTLGLDNEWKVLERQYDGELKKIQNLDFQIDVRESKIKVDAIARALIEAFIPDSGDIVDIKPRPEFSKNNGFVVAEKQQQFLDWAIDEEIKPEQAFRKIFISTIKNFVGIGKLVWKLQTCQRRREEHWEAKLVPVGFAPDGSQIVDNEGLRNFVSMYPDAVKLYPQHVKKLSEGKSIDIVVNYKEQVFNNPELQYVALEDFFVRNSCEYNKGLQTEHLIVERRRFSYWQLKEEKTFKNVDKIFEGTDGKVSPDMQTKEYCILECTTFFEMDKEKIKIKCWIEEEKQVFLGAIQYPYYGLDCDYVGFWATTNDYGFYGNAKSIMADLRDTHIAQDALISLMLQGVYIRNILTPIVPKGSDVEKLFLEHRFHAGSPIPISDMIDGDINKAFRFVEWGNIDLNGGLSMAEKIKRIGSDVTRVSDLTTGGESQLDPNAPATKTIALLQQSGQGIKDYIKTIKPSFDMVISGFLQLYYQMSTEDRAYKVTSKSKQITGENVFSGISRGEMAIKTIVQSRASTFAFEKVQEAQKALAAYNLIMASPYAQRQPELMYKSLKTLLETFGEKWKILADSDLQSPEDFKKGLEQQAMQAIIALMQQTQGNMQALTENAPQAINQAQTEQFLPPQQQGGR